MLILKFFELFLLALLVLFLLTQVMVPLVRNLPLFPFFRKQHELEEELLSLNQVDVEDLLQTEIEERKETKLNKRKEKDVL